ncbi:MAG: HAMP domain-containing histidine kinase [Ferruginibacter sp.]|nr:HAMP domain-containing histidine kinase [Cytophagales bacterium]
MDIYDNKSKYKIIIFLIALLISSSSVYYTNRIVTQLALREKRQIELYAKAMQSLTDHDSDENINFLFTQIIRSNTTVPVILVNKAGEPTDSRNVDLPDGVTPVKRQQLLRQELKRMKEEYPPVVLRAEGETTYIYYRNSYLLAQLKYYPYVQLSGIFVFVALAYLAFSYSRKAEQNRVWVGLAKETAHQLGTPLSSLMAWIEYFITDPKFDDDAIIPELEKDVQRLEMITTRFSNIGSVPTLKSEDLAEVVQGILGYLQRRISTKVKMTIHNRLVEGTTAQINRYLFEWVIENICKNAVDAMGGIGEMNVVLHTTPDHYLAIDISDSGKGIAKNHLKRVFEPGFSTKKRGWGLGLTLARRIIENYHQGRIFVKHSEPGKGTTFRIVLGEKGRSVDEEVARHPLQELRHLVKIKGISP